METAFKVMRLLPWTDWAALVVFVSGWAGYVHFARDGHDSGRSILAVTNRVRRQWMMQATYREVRVFDGVVVQALSTSPSFFASTTILIIGGLLALLGASDKATDLVRDIPFAARTTTLVFDMKVLLLLAIYIYAFFRFTWAMRQYTFGALLIAAAPEAVRFEAEGLSREEFAERAGKTLGLAAETFNDGLRAYYFSFAAVGWFFSPLAFALVTLGVVYVLYQREFRSEVLTVLSS